jgi:hypothetical protein
MNHFRKLLNEYTNGTEPIHYLLSAGVIAVKLVTNVPRTIEYIADDIAHNTMERHIGNNVKLDKTTDLKFHKDEEFADDRMSNSMMIWTRFPPETTLDVVRETCESVSNDCFGVAGEVVVCEVATSHQHMIDSSKKTQTQVMGTDPCVFYVFPKERKVMCYADHYYADGKFVFEFTTRFISICLGREMKYAKFIPYTYIPVISDAKMVKRWGELIESYVRHPVQNMMSPTTRIRRLDMKPLQNIKSGRWTNYARALYPLFQVSDREYFQVGITVGLDVPRFYTNNRVGSVMFTLHRPDMTSPYEEVIHTMASTIERDVTKNKLDAFLSYDTAAAFDTHLIRKLGFRIRSSCDVVLSPFHYVMDGSSGGDTITDQSCEYLRDTWGCFGGAMDFPYIYVAAQSCGDAFGSVYQTNVPDIHLERLVESPNSAPIGDMIEFNV